MGGEDQEADPLPEMLQREVEYAANVTIGPRRLSLYIIALCLSVVAAYTDFDNPLSQFERWMEMGAPIAPTGPLGPQRPP